ncbi:MAG: J domain-containing protein [Alphaproteobacteria bacterium]
MVSSSNYFDGIRIKPRTKPTKGRGCDWAGCNQTGTHPAPKGRSNEGQFHYFCTVHARQYNKSYNYFDGMPAADVKQFQKDVITGHRPTWKLGARGAGVAGNRDERDLENGLDGARGAQEPMSGAARKGQRPQVGNAARKAFDALGLENSATSDQVKAKFKALVKRHHPDANGGSEEAKDRLIEIIQAHAYLREAGFC